MSAIYYVLFWGRWTGMIDGGQLIKVFKKVYGQTDAEVSMSLFPLLFLSLNVHVENDTR